MRVETDTGVILYWPPHEGVLYCAAGPVSRNVRIVLIGHRRQVEAALTTERLDAAGGGKFWRERLKQPHLTLAPMYQVTCRFSNIRKHSPPIPPPGDFVMRERRVCSL